MFWMEEYLPCERAREICKNVEIQLNGRNNRIPTQITIKKSKFSKAHKSKKKVVVQHSAHAEEAALLFSENE